MRDISNKIKIFLHRYMYLYISTCAIQYFFFKIGTFISKSVQVVSINNLYLYVFVHIQMRDISIKRRIFMHKYYTTKHLLAFNIQGQTFIQHLPA